MTLIAYSVALVAPISLQTQPHSIMGNKVSLEEELINMRIVSKQMIRSSKKCEKNEKAAKDKLKKVRLVKLSTQHKWETLIGMESLVITIYQGAIVQGCICL